MKAAGGRVDVQEEAKSADQNEAVEDEAALEDHHSNTNKEEIQTFDEELKEKHDEELVIAK